MLLTLARKRGEKTREKVATVLAATYADKQNLARVQLTRIALLCYAPQKKTLSQSLSRFETKQQ